MLEVEKKNCQYQSRSPLYSCFKVLYEGESPDLYILLATSPQLRLCPVSKEAN